MREFATPPRAGSRLQGMTFETRLIYTLYLLLAGAGYIVIGVMVATRTGLGPEQYTDFYRGNEAAGLYGKSLGELLDFTHFHLFSYPLLLLVQGHVFLLTGWSRRARCGVVVAAFLGAALYIAAPWLVTYVHPALAWVATLGRILMLPPLVLFLVVPLWEMWAKRHK